MPKYQYGLTDIKYVKQNPEEYIIPDCLEACKILWSKGIDTTQCSNYEDNFRYIEIDSKSLSADNYKLIYELCRKQKGFMIGKNAISTTHDPRIYSDIIGVEAANELCNLANMLLLQDTNKYVTTDEYLDYYKRLGGELKVLPNGNVQSDYNPEKKNATLSEALTYYNEWNLYVEEENRIYESEYDLDWHLHYLNIVNRKKR